MVILRAVLQGPKWGFAWTEESLLEELKHSRAFGIFEGAELRSFLLYRQLDLEHEIMTLASHPLEQRKGWMRGLLSQAINASASGSVWRLEVHAKNTKALRLYESLGFKEQRRRGAYYADGGEAIEMANFKVELKLKT